MIHFVICEYKKGTKKSGLCKGVFDLTHTLPLSHWKSRMKWRFRDLLWKWKPNNVALYEIFSFVKLIQTTNHYHLSFFPSLSVFWTCMQGFAVMDFFTHTHTHIPFGILCQSGCLERLWVWWCVCVHKRLYSGEN